MYRERRIRNEVDCDISFKGYFHQMPLILVVQYSSITYEASSCSSAMLADMGLGLYEDLSMHDFHYILLPSFAGGSVPESWSFKG